MKIQGDTRSKIIEVARTLMSSKDYGSVSMASIAHEAGIAKSSLYYFFKNKEELYLNMLHEIILHVTKHYTLDSSIPPSKQLLKKKIEQSIEYGIQNGLIILMSETKVCNTNSKEITELVLAGKHMKDTMVHFLKKCGVKNSKQSAQLVIDTTHAYVKRVLLNIEDVSPQKFSEYLTNLLTQ